MAEQLVIPDYLLYIIFLGIPLPTMEVNIEPPRPVMAINVDLWSRLPLFMAFDVELPPFRCGHVAIYTQLPLFHHGH